MKEVKYICDVCEKPMTLGSTAHCYSETIDPIDGNRWDYRLGDIDICPACYLKFKIWLKEKGKKNEKTNDLL